MLEFHLFICEVRDFLANGVIAFKSWKDIPSTFRTIRNITVTDMIHFKFNLHY